MYAHVSNGTIDAWPLGLLDIRLRHPNTSFPSEVSDDLLAELGYLPLSYSPEPEYNRQDEKVIQEGPFIGDGQCFFSWSTVPLTQEEKTQLELEEGLNVRVDRNKRLADCDWTQLPDAPVVAADWAAYRQELRDVTAQAGFPWDVTWPEAP